MLDRLITLELIAHAQSGEVYVRDAEGAICGPLYWRDWKDPDTQAPLANWADNDWQFETDDREWGQQQEWRILATAES